jgi:uncharacterized protein YjbI with pentapeptide repeats
MPNDDFVNALVHTLNSDPPVVEKPKIGSFLSEMDISTVDMSRSDLSEADLDLTRLSQANLVLDSENPRLAEQG